MNLPDEGQSLVFPELVRLLPGNIPVFLNASHGGFVRILGVPSRKTGLRFRDMGTLEFARALRRAVRRASDGVKYPWLVGCKAHRRYVDLNRSPSKAYEHPKAGAFYNFYYSSLERLFEEDREKKRRLLLDIHGFDSKNRPESLQAVDVFVGTRQNTTIQKQSQGANPKELLIDALNRASVEVHPPDITKYERVFPGGHLIAHFGALDSIDALQVELSERARFGSYAWKQGVKKAIATFILDWLEGT